MTTNYDGDDIEIKATLPLLPIRDIVVYPFMILPLFVGRKSSMEAVEHAIKHSSRIILLVSQKDTTAENPGIDDIYDTGTAAMIMRMRKLPDGRIKILVQGLSRIRITEFEQNNPFFTAKTIQAQDVPIEEESDIINALMKNIRDQLEKVIALGKNLSPDILTVLEDIQNPGRLADLIASNINLHVSEAQSILETLDPMERLQKISTILNREIEILSIQAKNGNPNNELNRNQKEYFLREQIRSIKSELGEDSYNINNDEFSELKEKIVNCKMPEDIEKEALKQLLRFEKMHPDSSESGILRTYIEWLVELPWSVSSQECCDLKQAKDILNEDHFDLKKVKERILEFLAVKQLKGEVKGPILCFSGPPGVGKTSLGKSIARAMGRKFVRISLGGVADEAEVRGHRRTYVGSMPGRFIQALKQVKTNNPVILLDEVDKLGSNFKGDPSSALLEVLDPEQNHSFRDHYINLPFNLSNCIFIATSNILDDIPPPLKDRMEIIYLSGYTQEEKIAIAKKYLIPKQINENGITHDNIQFSDEALISIIHHFTSEAGLRNLERKIGALCRKVAMKIATGEANKTHIMKNTVTDLLGPPLFNKEEEKEFDEIGVSTGLAWTSVGGEILYIEATKMKGNGGLTLTGQLGDVMKESAQAAIGHIRSKAAEYGINEDVFKNNELHIHIPSGAIPKDGPSAGITLATAIISRLVDVPVNHKVAMTGEITLTGKVLPVGGLKEKILAAMRVNINTVIIPFKNKKDVLEIEEEYREKINFIFVKTIDEVLEIALVGWKERQQKILKKKVNRRAKKHAHRTPMAA